ncbi:putative elongin-A [Monocercomonoides exilis]|uniref:putative elongin-A n=1 Tax=Monocercomonoides exilis TaxID=2049356 RepID=UPI00355A064C|nr:putative elongin-A [Monocercomonoides exilis]|eukprot:MONOS_5091.1-p1 / transcript=MONOS_5091.1 / gene=MONOS_5091 / organism=Monocercomonoides_exilis_PA203 / gene_product=unspecified product / transcript_product=unspecified product / location=Mono_scaffold00144:73874-75034(-) / protein_length=386 / sequence_SO=supercontig / SO=protein_coding / is_pseudo=false
MLSKKEGQKNIFDTTLCFSSENIPSLFLQCQMVLKENLAYLNEIGDIPLELLEPVLFCCTVLDLERIEASNPFLSDDALNPFWMTVTLREFSSTYVCSSDLIDEIPKKYGSWHRYYRLCLAEKKRKERAIQELARQSIQQSLAAYKQDESRPAKYIRDKGRLVPLRPVIRSEAFLKVVEKTPSFQASSRIKITLASNPVSGTMPYRPSFLEKDTTSKKISHFESDLVQVKRKANDKSVGEKSKETLFKGAPIQDMKKCIKDKPSTLHSNASGKVDKRVKAVLPFSETTKTSSKLSTEKRSSSKPSSSLESKPVFSAMPSKLVTKKPAFSSSTIGGCCSCAKALEDSLNIYKKGEDSHNTMQKLTQSHRSNPMQKSSSRVISSDLMS